MKIPASYYQSGKLLPIYFTELLYQILSKRDKSIDIAKLVNMAHALRENNIESVEKKLFLLAKIEASYFRVDEYPSFKLRRSSRFPDLSDISDGTHYVSSAAKILVSSRDYVDVREIVQMVESKKLYRFANIVPEYWMYLHLASYSEYFLQKGMLKIGLKEWNAEANFLKPQEELVRKTPNRAARVDDASNITPNIHETHLESILIERLEVVEEGLQLIKRQYDCSGVGRIDLLCKDKKGNLVVIELKKFGVKHDSILDQILRYMGYIKEHLAKGNQKVRGIIVVGKVDERLRYAVLAAPDITVKTFNLTIE